jgi:hypothetical protein
MMNQKEYGRKKTWPNLRYYPSICLEWLRKTTKNRLLASLQAERKIWQLYCDYSGLENMSGCSIIET